MLVNKKLFNKLTSIVLSTTMLGSLVGCTTNKPGDINNEGLVLEEIYIDELNELYEIKNNDLDYYTSANLEDCSLIMCEPYEYNRKYDINDFNSMVSDGATWEDIINAIEANNELNSTLKNILLSGVNNLINQDVQPNLNILKYNLEHLKVKHVDKVQAGSTLGVAEFKVNEHTVYIDDTEADKVSYDKLICHEILGHGSTQAFIDNNLYSSYIGITNKVNGKTILYSILGFTFEEAVADYIAFKAINKKLDNLSEDSVYAEHLFYFLLMCESLDITPNDYMNYGYRKVLNKCKEIGSPDVLSWLMWIDVKNIYITCKNSDVPFSFNDILTLYITSLIEADKTIDEERINEIFDSYKSMIIPVNMDGNNYILTSTIDLTTIDIDGTKDECINYYRKKIRVK